ncbi:MAG: MipA/OmpV family protein [Betaproteobacteria bacterium]|jgi:outer membrane protein|nr:MipA/OmpV family protein [Betaproteobacteria bacterium]MDH5285544.1 MipA/OmpV family protein [Betaproteobacteria bacterium]
MSRIRSGIAPLIAAACAAALAHASAVSAQVSIPAGLTPQKIAEMVPNLAGIGVGAVPDYVGSDDYTWAAAPAFYYKFGNSNRYVDWWGIFGSVNLIDSPTWSAGPTLQFRPGRKDVDDAVVKRMSEIDNSWEAGLFVGYQHINTQGIPWIARVSAGVQWNLGNEYDDPYWWASGQFFFPLREDLFVGLGGGLGGGSSSYNQTYFGVSAADALASGLPRFSPSGGVSNVYVWPALVWRFHPNWLGAVGGMYSRVTGDAGDSPIVKDRGDANQWIGGVGVAYIWK